MDFKLSEKHQLAKEVYEKFAQAEVAPLAQEMDEKEEFSMPLLEKMQKAGFLGIPFPKEYGGQGADILSYALCVEELSKKDGSTGVTVSVHTSLCAYTIFEQGTQEQKKEYLTPLINGSKVGCFGLTEPGAGSDASGLVTTAVKDGDNYIINGSKIFTTNAEFADTIIVFAVTDKEAGTKGISAFIVDKNSQGISVGKSIPRMGIRGASNCEVFYENVKVPSKNLLGAEGKGFKIAMQTLDGGRIGIAAQALGIAEGALENAIEYTKQRKQFGKSIASFQNSQFKLAEMQTKIEAARYLVYKAATLKDNHEAYGPAAAMAKLFASETANEVARMAVQLMGGYGYMREYPVERMLRDAKITEIYEGTSEVMKMVVAGSMNLR